MGRGYLVTGGAGFIGSHLVGALLAQGTSVVVLDDLSTGRLANLAGVADHERLRVVRGSVLDTPVVDELVAGADTVVHLAAAVGVRLVLDAPVASFITNLRGSQIVAESAVRYGRRLLLASSSEVYGKNPAVPLAETADSVLGPPSVARWAYARAKAGAEALVLLRVQRGELDATVVRLFNTVGPRQSGAYGMVVPRLVGQAVRDQPLTVYGDGRQTRCFCHVADAVDAIVGLVEHPEATGQVFNVGSNEEVRIVDLARRVAERAGSSAGVELVPYDVAYPHGFEDVRRRVPDITKIRSLTGWTPKRPLDETLSEGIAVAVGGRSPVRAPA